MKRDASPIPIEQPLEDLVNHALAHLETLGYRDHTLKPYRAAWKALREFAEHDPASRSLSGALTARFLASRGIAAHADGARLTWSQGEARRAVRILTEFAAQGSYRRHRKRREEPRLPAELAEAYAAYERFCCEQLKHSSRTTETRRRLLTHFLRFLAARHLSSWRDLTPVDLSAYVRSLAHLGACALANVAAALRSFLRYLRMHGSLPWDGAAHVLPIRFAKERRLPSVWPQAAVETLLTQIDRTTALGRRDYAILLLAARLGLRAGDIRALRLEDIRWAESQITLRQAKTGRWLTLPLAEEVGRALIDYLRDGRPATPHRTVFLKARAPIEPFGPGNDLSTILRSHLRQAKLALPAGTRRGLHAWRHTLATQLLRAGEPLETIAGLLGHQSIETTRGYTRLDVEALRGVALDPDEVFHA